MNLKKTLAFLAIPLLISCATITVNVYFPDKDVEAAYENIEKGLDFDVVHTKKDTQALKAKPKSRSESVFGILPAYAEGQININAELEKMEDVQESMARRKERIETLVQLFDAWRVGLGNSGLIAKVPAAERPDSPPAESIVDIFGEDGGDTAFSKFVSDENKDRQILTRGMAVATLRATEQDERDKEALAGAVEKSRSIFARSQKGKLKTGWFYQDEKEEWRRVEPPPPPKEEKSEKKR